MKRLALILLLVPGLAFAEPVDERPETAGRWFLTAVYSSLDAPTERDQQLYSILRTDPRLVNLINQVNFVEWDNTSRFVNNSAWKAYLGSNRPALLLQTPANSRGVGSVVYFASGPHLKTDSNLADSLAAAIERYQQRTGATDCPRCPLRPQPVYPVQPVQPVQPQIPVIVPDSRPSPPQQPAKEETPLLLILGLPLLGAGFGLFKSLQNESAA